MNHEVLLTMLLHIWETISMNILYSLNIEAQYMDYYTCVTAFDSLIASEQMEYDKFFNDYHLMQLIE